MHSALIAVEIQSEQAFLVFMAAANKAKEMKGVSRLADNVWQVNFQLAPAALAALVLAADRQGLAYKILPFDAEPQWIQGNPNSYPK
jgi:hypothetical protein